MISDSVIRRKMLEIKHLKALSYRALGDEVGIHGSVLQQFGNQTGILSRPARQKLCSWIEKNGGGYVFLENDNGVSH